MIRHDIVVNKPKITVTNLVTRPEGTSFQTKWAYRGTLQSDTVYQEYLKEVPIRPGNFVKLASIEEATSLAQVHYVVGFMKDVKSVPFRFERGHPFIVCLMQMITVSGNTPWIRWEPPINHVPLTEKEYDKLIGPDYARLQDYIETHKQGVTL